MYLFIGFPLLNHCFTIEYTSTCNLLVHNGDSKLTAPVVLLLKLNCKNVIKFIHTDNLFILEPYANLLRRQVCDKLK